MITHDFTECLEQSHQCEDAPYWIEIYQNAFPNLQAAISHRKDGQHQRNGIDRSLILDNGKQLFVDEKARFGKYGAYRGDILLEYVSNNVTGALGWVEKPLLADYIAVAFTVSGHAFLLPVPQMQAAWQKHKDEWVSKYSVPPAQNRSYQTLNCCVPTSELYAAIGKMLRVNFTP